VKERAEFGVVVAPTEYLEVKHRFFRRVESLTRVDYLDWTVDGILVRQLFVRANPHWTEPRECTFIPPEGPLDQWVADSVRTLLGEEGFSESASGFGGGRVGILFCNVCAGLDCHTLSAEVVVEGNTVTWNDIGYQTDEEPFTLGDDQVGVSATFDRTQYEDVIRGVLVRAEG